MSTALLAPRRKRSVSLTALIDVVFILLMFFMLTSSFSRLSSINLQAPAPGTSATASEAQFIVLHEDGQLSIYGKPKTQYPTVALALNALDMAKPLVVVPESAASVQAVVSAMEALKAGGVKQISLASPLQKSV